MRRPSWTAHRRVSDAQALLCADAESSACNLWLKMEKWVKNLTVRTA